MIQNIDASKKSFTFDTGNGIKEFKFSDILKSEPWKEIGVVTINYYDGLGKKITTSFARNSFLDNITYHLPEHRDKVSDYEQDVLVYKLYRLLDGEDESSIDEGIDNIYQQRVSLEERKNAFKQEVSDVISDFVSKKEANEAREIKRGEMGFVMSQVIECIRTVDEYERTGELPNIRQDIRSKESMFDVLENYSLVNADIRSTDIAILKKNEELEIKREALNCDKARLEEDDGKEAEKIQSLINSSGDAINTLTEELTVLARDKDNLTERRLSVERDIIEKVKEVAVLSQERFKGLKARVDEMPHYKDLPEIPELPAPPLSVPKEMQKMILVSQNESMPEVSLKNMTPELAKSALESKLAKTRKDL